MRLRTKQGKGGKWRWHLYSDSDRHIGMSSIFGYATQAEAERAAKMDLGSAVTLETADGNLYAGDRDWA